MKNSISLFNHWFQAYKKCTKKLNQLRLTNKNKKRQGRLAINIRRLQKRLANWQTSFQRAAMTAAAVGALTFTSQTSWAQNFGSPVFNPFGIIGLDQYAIADFADMDGDGDLDILSGIYYGDFYYYQNTGSKTNPSFEASALNPFGLSSTGVYNYPTVADLDGDGDPDIMSVSFDGEFIYYQNTGTAEHPGFVEPETSPFGLHKLYTLFFPSFVDLDKDGDFDIMAGLVFSGAFAYFENTGTPTAPAFAAGQLSPFGLPNEAYITNPAFADLDNDGDLDLMTGGYYGEFTYFRNIGNASAPVFDTQQSNPYHLAPIGYITLPFFVDLDGDSDTDLMAIDYSGNYIFYENHTRVPIPPLYDGQDLGDILYPNPNPGNFKIDVSQAADIEIIDALGRIVYSKCVHAGTEDIDLSQQGEGLFIVKIISGDRKIMHQVVVQR